MMCGGFTGEKPMDDETKQMVMNLQGQILQRCASNAIITFEPVSYKTQVVAGLNYKIRVKIAPNKFIFVTVYQNLQGNPT